MATEPPESDVEALVENLLQSTGLLRRRLRAEANPDELSWSQVAVIARLKRDGPATIADLARAEGVKPQSMGVTVGSLEREGLVTRRPHPTDGRQFLYDLTAAGEDARTRLRLLKRTWLATAMARLDEEEKESLRLALQVVRRLADS
jgi:DNA-binding MarR family transcriptional regulator